MKLLGSLIVTIALFGPVPTFAQQSPNQWLIGHWDGTIEGFPASDNPSRILRVHKVSADGKTVALLAVPGSKAAQTETSTDGTNVKVAFPGSKMGLELAREGEDSLGGKYTGPIGKTFPIKFKKAKLSAEFDGEWQGQAKNTPRNNQECVDGNYYVTVKDSLITGSFQLQSRIGGGTLEALVTGEIQPDKTAVLEVKPLTPRMVPARFSGTFKGNEFHGSDPPVDGRRCGYEVDLKKR